MRELRTWSRTDYITDSYVSPNEPFLDSGFLLGIEILASVFCSAENPREFADYSLITTLAKRDTGLLVTHGVTDIAISVPANLTSASR